jgi:2-aminophenol/2-amino-5-chlorophenol 1,6-dioxygenase alpha subunit
MPLVAAFLVPGQPLHFLRPAEPPYSALVAGHAAAAQALAAARPEVLIVYSTQWIAVLDELWQLRPHVQGLHVDENWYEYGDLPFDLRIDTDLTAACIAATPARGTAKAISGCRSSAPPSPASCRWPATGGCLPC